MIDWRRLTVITFQRIPSIVIDREQHEHRRPVRGQPDERA